MSRHHTRRSSGQLVMHEVHRPGQGWCVEIWTFDGTLKFTTPVFKEKDEALEAAKAWKREQREGKRP